MKGQIMRFGNRKNYGYGRSLTYAAKLALRELYGGGHYGSVKSHSDRWKKFASFMREIGKSDAREIDQEVLDAFLVNLKREVDAGNLSVIYAVNITSSVNVVLLAMRGNQKLRLKPSDVGAISTVRVRPPGFMNSDQLMTIVQALEAAGHVEVAAMVDIAGNCGLRLKEAGLYQAKSSVLSAKRNGGITVKRGTKGGQRRFVPVNSEEKYATLVFAKRHQTNDSFIPEDVTYAAFRQRVYRIFRKFGIFGQYSFKELRAAFACREYHRITGYPAPVMGGAAPPDVDKAARLQIAEELGHHRIDVCSSYFGKLVK